MPIRYPRAIWDDQLRRLISDAQVAEVPYTAFTSRTGQAMTARLIVRRVKDLKPKAAAGQAEQVFAAWRYHAVFTDSPFEAIQAKGAAPRPRPGRAGLRRLDRRPPRAPGSGSFPANAAWLALAAISCDLLRAAGALASLTYAKARGAALRATSSASPPAPPAMAAATSPCISPKTGTANTSG